MTASSAERCGIRSPSSHRRHEYSYRMTEPYQALRSSLAGRYDVQRELGEGGMATVYLADDVRHGRKVAIKVMRPEVAATLGTERFLAEIKLTAKLQHPHILGLIDSGVVGDESSGLQPFYVMPLIIGETLRGRLSQGSLPTGDTRAAYRDRGCSRVRSFARRHSSRHQTREHSSQSGTCIRR